MQRAMPSALTDKTRQLDDAALRAALGKAKPPWDATLAAVGRSRRRASPDRLAVGAVAALNARNAAASYVVLKDEGHGLSRTESLLVAYGATDRFLDRSMWGDTSVEVVK
jgi:hypothetical protein